jgi:D-alanyl-D-alanine carboxypeptidase
VEGFVELMNDKARQLGLTGTHFENPNGLDSPGHYSTARDLALLAQYAMNDPVFAQTVSTKTVKIGQRSLRNHNKLLWRVEGADGVKTGYTKAAGRILVSSATRNGRRLICVTINAPDDWNDHGMLLEDGFRRYSPHRLVTKGQRLASIPIAGGTAGSAELLAEHDFEFSLAEGERTELSFSGPGFVYAPVAEGAEAGFAHILVDGVPVGKVPMVYGRTVEMETEVKKGLLEKLFGR